MNGRNAAVGGNGGRKMTVYVCWEGFVEEGAGGLCYKGERSTSQALGLGVLHHLSDMVSCEDYTKDEL